jgi:hypothetical protein
MEVIRIRNRIQNNSIARYDASFPRRRESSGKLTLDNDISNYITAFKMVLDVLPLRPD